MSDTDATEGVAVHAGYVDGLKLALGLCLCYTLCIVCLRTYIRWRASGRDDAVVVVATVLALAFFGCAYTASGAGLGAPYADLLSAPESKLRTLNDSLLAGNILWVLSLCLSKAAIIAMLMRTTQTPEHRRMQWGAAVLIVVQCVASIVLLTAACGISDDEFTWDLKRNAVTCPKQEMRWQIITALDVTTEFILLALPIHLTWNLQMSLKTKAIVVLAFWLRLPTLICSILRQTTTHTLLTTSDISLTSTLVLIYQTVELSYSLAAVTIAALKSFTETLNTGFGHGELVRVHGTSSYKMTDRSATVGGTRRSKLSGKSRDLSVTVGSIDAGDHRDREPTALPVLPEREAHGKKGGEPGLMLRPGNLRNTASISCGLDGRKGHGDGSESSSEDRENFIRQEIQYSVRYDEAPLVGVPSGVGR
ncbi:hypothetical protein K491DRAFT_755063 [Lophiostoma macrostomum CBS 122681]|uniref:Rhodopsin domain-containing protein n=1 Tax=Lophiostoma macrostomum CBS 122681 TaxID=1314788 RepID=A0A6A6TKB5_9PLEO|nr:hypothetical protein K491DRAFT_755063 [Lophiostoma macrostomum CBS 122681]